MAFFFTMTFTYKISWILIYFYYAFNVPWIAQTEQYTASTSEAVRTHLYFNHSLLGVLPKPLQLYNFAGKLLQRQAPRPQFHVQRCA